MKRRKPVKKNQKSIISNYFKRGELWIGMATVVVILALLSKLSLPQLIASSTSYRIMIVKVTPTPSSIKHISAPASIHLTPTQTQPVIRSYTIQDGDSYFTATQKVCGNGTYYIYNQQLNADKPLQIGDTLQIRCNWE